MLVLEKKMVDPNNITKLYLGSLSESQLQNHVPEDTIDEDGNIVKGEVESIFSYKFVPTSWSAHVVTKLNRTRDNDNNDEYIFTANNKFSFLLHTFLRIEIPNISVKKKFSDIMQIAWPHNLGHNINRGASLIFDDKIAQTMDSVWLDMHSQFYMKSKQGARDHYNLMIGNVPCLEDWNTRLPRYTLNCPQPWFYSKDTMTAIPLYLCKFIDVKHKYNFRLKISDLLRVRYRKKIITEEDFIDDNGDTQTREIITYTEWKYKSHSSMKNLYKYIDCDQETLNGPSMYGKYAHITENELNYRKGKKYVLHGEDIITIDTKNPKVKGSVSINLNCDSPCKGIFWVTSNTKANKIHNLSNYTTNYTDSKLGWSPTNKSTLNIGKDSKTSIVISHNDSALVGPWYGTDLSAPSETGYNVKLFSYNSSSLNGDVSLVPNNLNLSLDVNLSDTNIYNSILSDDDLLGSDNDSDAVVSDNDSIDSTVSRYINTNIDDLCSYDIKVRLLTMQTITFENNGVTIS